jgi:RNA-binding protein PNO1
MEVDDEDKPEFPALSATALSGGKSEMRRIRCPPNRYTPLKESWDHIMNPLIEHMKLQVRFNPKNRSVELKTSEHTAETEALQKGADFVQAFMLGFEVQDAIALLRLDSLYIGMFSPLILSSV